MTTADTTRLDYAKLAPDLFKRLLNLSMGFHMDEGLALLVDIRASQLNGCAFCVDMHTKQAKIHGERELRLHHLVVWRESPLFTPKERAALAWTETLTQLGHEAASNELFAATREHFTDEELSELTFRIAAINAWNRLGIGFRSMPGSRDKAYGIDKSGLA